MQQRYTYDKLITIISFADLTKVKIEFSNKFNLKYKPTDIHKNRHEDYKCKHSTKLDKMPRNPETINILNTKINLFRNYIFNTREKIYRLRTTHNPEHKDILIYTKLISITSLSQCIY